MKLLNKNTLFVVWNDFLTADKACWKSGRDGF